MSKGLLVNPQLHYIRPTHPYIIHRLLGETKTIDYIKKPLQKAEALTKTYSKGRRLSFLYK